MTSLSPNDQLMIAAFIALHAAGICAWLIGWRTTERRRAAQHARFEAAMAALGDDEGV